jgi:hypothetical protein
VNNECIYERRRSISKGDLRAEIGQLKEEKRKLQAMVNMLQSDKRYSTALVYLWGNCPDIPNASPEQPGDSGPMVDAMLDKIGTDHDSLQHPSQDALFTKEASSMAAQVSLMIDQVSPTTEQVLPATRQYTKTWDVLDAFSPEAHLNWQLMMGQTSSENNASSVSGPDARLSSSQSYSLPFMLDGRASKDASQYARVDQNLLGRIASSPAYSVSQVSPGAFKPTALHLEGQSVLGITPRE